MSRAGAVFVSYNGLLDPLGPSQILPYIERIARDRSMWVVSFERRDRWNAASASLLRSRLDSNQIRWISTWYHKRPSVLAKAFDLWAGVTAVRRAIREGASIIHARGYFPMEMALRATKQHPVLFDIRGLQGEEYVDGGIWTTRDPRYLLLKRSERSYFRRAAAAVVLTQAIEPYVRGRFAELGRMPPIEVIPSAVDLTRFRIAADARAGTRARLRADEHVVFIYSGSLGTWYLAREMARFVRVFRDTLSRKVLLFWQVNTEPEIARQASADEGLDPAEIVITSTSADGVPDELSGADVGLALIKPCFSKKASSPTKYGEYLATGLPLVMTAEVGDSAELADQGAGVALAGFGDEDLRRACLQLASMLNLPRDRFRAIAERSFDIETVAVPAYQRLYDAIEARIGDAH